MDTFLTEKITAVRLAIDVGLPPSRERSLAVTKLDEYELWLQVAFDQPQLGAEGPPVVNPPGVEPTISEG